MQTRRQIYLPLYTMMLAMIAFLNYTFSTVEAREWAVECCEDYSECGGSDLPNSCDLTDAMVDEMDSVLGSWEHGINFRNSSAFPQDWQEAATVGGGLDDSIMDAIGKADLSVWSGHGTAAAVEPNGRWDLAMGFDHLGVCDARSPDDIKLGEQGLDGFASDGDNEYVIMDASCGAVFGERRDVWYIWRNGIMVRTHQGMGFHNSPPDTDERLEEFIENIDDGDSNKTAWLDAAEECAWWTCFTSPVIFTFGDDCDDARDRRAHETLRSPRSDPTAGTSGCYAWSRIDNGSC